MSQRGLEIPFILMFQTANADLSDKSRELIENSLAMNIKIFKKGEKMRVEPVHSSSQSVHGVEIKIE